MSAKRTDFLRSIAAVGAVVVTTAGCAGVTEQASEQAVEEAVEQAVENDSGENVDVEFGDDGISIESDDGDFTLTADEKGVEIDGSDADGGEFTLDADENGIELDSDDATGSLRIDEDGGFTVTDEDGEVFSGDVDTDGDTVDFRVEGDDGDAVFASSEGIPDEWPDDIPQPSGISSVTGTVIAGADEVNIIIVGTVDGEAGPDVEMVFDVYTARLVEAGFRERSTTTSDGLSSAAFTRDDRTVSVSVSVSDIEGAVGMVVTVT